MSSVLCDFCSKLGFHSLVRRARNPEPPGSEIYQDLYDREDHELYDGTRYLGSIRELRARQSSCSLCALILTRIENACEVTDNFLYFAHSQTFCGQKLDRNPKRYTKRVCIMIGDPENPILIRGNPKPALAIKEIFQFQPCCRSVPTTTDVVKTVPQKVDPRFTNASIVVRTLRDKPDTYLLAANYTPKSVNEKAESEGQPVPYVEPSQQEVMLLATHRNTSDDARFSGRLIGKGEIDTGLLKYWMDFCHDTHKACKKSLSAGKIESIVQGLLLIDVHERCVVQATPDDQYAALSYCWGKVPALKHMRENGAAMTTPGHLTIENVPATIWDAMLLTGSLGLNFLWVDSLCIVQDDPHSKQGQIAQMGAIYANAAVTIVAASGDSAFSGLPGVRAGTRTIQQDVVELEDMSLLTVIDDELYGGVSKSTWNERAWTLQERALSPRKIIITQNQVYWQCLQGTFLEETVLENTAPMQFSSKPGSGSKDETNIRDESFGYYRKYEALVDDYCRRKLTFKSDALNAFSGITGALTTMSKSECFHWGLPASRFHWALGWQTVRKPQRNHEKSKIVRKDGAVIESNFPSWSWVGWSWDEALDNIPALSFLVKWCDPGDWNAMVDPEINFYREDVQGRLQAIQDPCLDPDRLKHALESGSQFYVSSSSDELRAQWKGSPLTISATDDHEADTEDFIDSGHLQFWSSRASFWIYYNGMKREYSAIPVLPEQLELEEPTRLFLGDVTHINFVPRPGTVKSCPRKMTPPRSRFGNRKSDLTDFYQKFPIVQRLMAPMSAQTAFHPNNDIDIDSRRHPEIPINRLEKNPFDDIIFSSETGEPKFMGDLNKMFGPEIPDQYGPNCPREDFYVDGSEGESQAFRADLVIIGRSIAEPERYLKALIVEWKDGTAYRIGCALVGEKDWVRADRSWELIRLG